jgi:uncharacterized protein (TIRG00374 family)
MKTKAIIFLKVAITALLFYFIFRNIDFKNFGTILKNARLEILIAAFIVFWMGHFVCIFRWRMLMRPLMPVRSVMNLFRIYCIGLFFNLTFPTVVGGDVVKIYYVGKHSNSYSQSFAATFLDRDVGMLAMMIIACAAILIYPVSVPGVAVEIIIWGGFAGFILGNVCLFTPRFRRAVSSLLLRCGFAKIAQKMERVSSVFHIIGKKKSVLLASLMISFLNQILYIASIWITSVGLGLNIGFSYFLIFVPVITLVSMIPVSLNGMGLREYAFMSLFSAIGVSPESCIALGLLSSIIIILSSLPGGVIYIFFKNKVDESRLTALEEEFS